MQSAVQKIDEQGFALVVGAIPTAEIDRLTLGIEMVMSADDQSTAAMRSRSGVVYAARNVLDLLPLAADCWRVRPLTDLLLTVLGSEFGLVRGLFFDKPPTRSWSLPWHRDQTIAVAEHVTPLGQFSRPTVKAGVPHVVAPNEVLKQILPLRIHLDDVTEENGPLQVIPGSHQLARSKVAVADKPLGRGGFLADQPAVAILAQRGDVLAMRPLVCHASGDSRPGTARHRRILHLEFAASPCLPDGFRWQQFIAGYLGPVIHVSSG